jgi:glycosyltransferase involved in cell wall biosynthesis
MAATSPLRVAVWHNLPSGGGKRALFDHVKGLVRKGHVLEAWRPVTKERPFLPLRDLITEHALPLDPVPIPRAIDWWFRHAGANGGIYAKLAAMSAHAEQFARELHAGRFDVLLAGSCQWFYAPMVTSRVRIPIVLYLQEPYRPLYEAMPTLRWIADDSASDSWSSPRALRRFLGSAIRLQPFRVQAREELRNVRACDRILVNSRFSRESVLRAYGIDAHVCYLGIDADRFQFSGAERRPVVLSVGEFIVQKNPEFVIRAVGMSGSKPILRWVANRADRACVERMQRLSAEVGVTLELNVDVSDRELVQHYQEALVMLYAPRLEPFGLAPLEANACGLPVIARAEGGVRETVVDGENGWVVDTPSQMATLIDECMREPGRAQALGHRASAIVRERWTLEAAADRLELHLREVAEARSTTSR